VCEVERRAAAPSGCRTRAASIPSPGKARRSAYRVPRRAALPRS
jgi:hypothetical protein